MRMAKYEPSMSIRPSSYKWKFCATDVVRTFNMDDRVQKAKRRQSKEVHPVDQSIVSERVRLLRCDSEVRVDQKTKPILHLRCERS